MDGKLIIFSAPSGSGKSTIINHLLAEGFPLEFSISATTRPPRGTEVHGKDYYFFSKADFVAKKEAGEFIEWEEVFTGRYYGTLKSEVERIWKTGKQVIFDVDVKGGKNLKAIYGDKALWVYIQPPSIEELRKRLLGRATESMEEIETRIARAEEEMTYEDQFDTIIVNNDLNEALAKAEKTLNDFFGAN